MTKKDTEIVSNARLYKDGDLFGVQIGTIVDGKEYWGAKKPYSFRDEKEAIADMIDAKYTSIKEGGNDAK